MAPYPFQNIVYQTNKRLRIILVLMVFLSLQACINEKDTSPTGEWRLKKISREASPGKWADKMQLSSNEDVPVYLKFEKEGTFVAETPKATLKGAWQVKAELGIVIIKPEGKKEDTLRIKKTGEKITALEAQIWEPDGLIRLSYKKEE